MTKPINWNHHLSKLELAAAVAALPDDQRAAYLDGWGSLARMMRLPRLPPPPLATPCHVLIERTRGEILDEGRFVPGWMFDRETTLRAQLERRGYRIDSLHCDPGYPALPPGVDQRTGEVLE